MKIDYQNNDYDLIALMDGQRDVLPLLEKAVSLRLFDVIEENRPLTEIKNLISEDMIMASRFLDVLYHAGLIVMENGYLFNAPVATKYLVTSSSFYFDSFAKKNEIFLWEQLRPLLGKAQGNCLLKGDFPLQKVPFEEGMIFLKDGPYDLIFSGSFDESMIAQCKEDGIIVLMGYFQGDYGLCGAVDLYRKHLEREDTFVIDGAALAADCKERGFFCTPPLSISADFSVAFVAKSESVLAQLTLTKEDRLVGALKRRSIRSVKQIDPATVVTASWVKDHCRFGCSSFGDRHCPPFSPGYEETQTRLNQYKSALLIEGQPPTRDFQRLMLQAEKAAFKAGYYKAFTYWAGSCSLCTECKKPLPPKKCTATRPSMESAGIDVFATVRNQGYDIRTVKDRREFVKYFGLLLLE
jgi:predicted metal-binding protein